MITKTGKYYFKPKLFGGFDLYIEEKIISDKFYPPIQDKYRYRKGTLTDLIELKIIHDNQK